MDVTIRRATEDDWLAIARQDSRAFGFHYSEQDLEDVRRKVDLRRFFVADDDGVVVGVTGDFPFQMTVPGGASVPVAGVTWVSVAPTHRRRGILTALMEAQHRSYLEQGLPLSILTASESGIYGRFGYGQATSLRRIEVDRRFATIRRDLPESGRVRMVEPDEARALLPDLYERWRVQTPGAINRTEPWWDGLFLDREHLRDGASALFYAVHPDGFVSYRTAEHWENGLPLNRVEVNDLFAVTAGASADLWRFLLGLDLVAAIRCWDLPPGDPLPFLLDQPRQAKTLAVNDGAWVRLLDVPASLSARRYATAGSVVLEVHDAFLGRGGRFALEGDPDGASCSTTDAPADLELGIGALGSAYLGQHSLATLARADLVRERTPGVLARASVMFGDDRPGHHGTHF